MASVAGSSSDAFFWVASRMKVSDRITSSSARIDFLRPTKGGHDHVRKYDDVAQRQHRIGSGFTGRKQWAWLCSGHGPKPKLLSLSAATRLCAATTECRGCGEYYHRQLSPIGVEQEKWVLDRLVISQNE